MLTLRSSLEKDLTSLNAKWLKAHMTINLISALSVAVAEAIISLVTLSDDAVEAFSLAFSNYILNYFLIPSLANFLSLLIQYLVFRSDKFSLKTKSYVLTLGLAWMCLVVSVVHSYFPVLMTVFVIPIIVSVIYGDKKLTSITTSVCFASDLVFSLFVRYDPDSVSPLADIEKLIQFFLSFVVMACIVLACHKIHDIENARLTLIQKQEHDKKMLQEEARTDQLTGLYNRLALSICCSEIKSDSNASSTYVLVIADLDSFKRVNDTFGHVKGDAVLYRIGSIIAKHCKGGLAFRYGGDEFCMIYKNISFNAVKEDCEDILSEFNGTLENEIKELGVSISFGIAGANGGTDPDFLISQADEQLYFSKRDKCHISIKY